MKSIIIKLIAIFFIFSPHLCIADSDPNKLSIDLEIIDTISKNSKILEKPSKLLIYAILSGVQTGNIKNINIIDSKNFELELVALNRMIKIPVKISFIRSEENKFFYISKANLTVFGISGDYQTPITFRLNAKDKSTLDLYLSRKLITLLPDNTLDKIENKINFLFSIDNQKKLSAYLLNQGSENILFELFNYKIQNNNDNFDHNFLTKLLNLVFFIFILYLPIILIIFRNKIHWLQKK